MISDVKFAKFVRFATGLNELSGVATFVQGNTTVDATGSNYVTDLTAGDILYDRTLGVIGTVDSVTDDGRFELTAPATKNYVGNLWVGTPTIYDFEGSSIVAGFDENRFESILVDGTIRQKTRWLRLFIGLSSPYLRRGSAGSYDFVDVVNADIDGTAILATIPDFDMQPAKVLRRTEGLSVSTAKFSVVPSLDYIFQAESVDTSYPDWFKFTKPAPGHLL